MDTSQYRVWNSSHCDEIITKLLLLEKVPFYNKEEWPKTGAYVSSTPPRGGNLQSVFDAVSGPSSLTSSSASSHKRNKPSTKWRENVVGWFYKIVDLAEYYFSRETVDIALSYLDAYLLRKGDRLFSTLASASKAMTEQAKNLLFKIISSTCIFLAIKLHESNHRFTIDFLMSLNGSSFTKDDILETEKDIVMTLDFRLSPPTIMSFVRPFLSLFDNIVIEDDSVEVTSLAPKAIKHVLGLARFLSELSMYEIFFVNKKTSHIALACVLTAFEGISRKDFPQAYRQKLVDKVFQVGNIDCTSKEVYACRVKLRQMFEDKRPPGRSPRPRPRPSPVQEESAPVQAAPVAPAPLPVPVPPSEEEKSSSEGVASASASQQVNTNAIETAAASIRISRPPEAVARNHSQQGVAVAGSTNTFPIGIRSSNNTTTSSEQALPTERSATSESTSSRTNTRIRPLPEQTSSCKQSSGRGKRHCTSE